MAFWGFSVALLSPCQLPSWAISKVMKKQAGRPEIEPELYTDITLSWILKCYDRRVLSYPNYELVMYIHTCIYMQWADRCGEGTLFNDWTCGFVPCHDSGKVCL